jgi:hypothetical protein
MISNFLFLLNVQLFVWGCGSDKKILQSCLNSRVVRTQLSQLYIQCHGNEVSLPSRMWEFCWNIVIVTLCSFDQISDGNNLKGGVIYFIYFNSWFQGVQFMVAWSCALGQNMLAAGAFWQRGFFTPGDRKQRKGDYRKGYRKDISSRTYWSLLPPAKSYLLKFPEPPKIVPPVGDQVFKTWVCGGHFIFKS